MSISMVNPLAIKCCERETKFGSDNLLQILCDILKDLGFTYYLDEASMDQPFILPV